MKSFYFKRKSVCLTALWGLLCLIGTIGLTSCDDKNEEDDVITLDSYYGATIDEAFSSTPHSCELEFFPTMSSQK